MTSQYHIDEAKWATLSIFEQMGNIYSEIGRAFNARRSNDTVNSQAATYRAIDLFDLTARNLATRHSPKTKEVLRAKDQFLSFIQQPKLDEKPVAELDRYFMQFAIAARLNR